MLALGCTGEPKRSELLGERQQALTVAVPHRIKSADFSAFRDNDTVHEGNCGSGPVDSETTTDPTGGGCNVGWTRAGEWLEYSIQVATAGKYDLTARVASALSAKTFRLALDGTDLAGSLVAPSTGWQAFADRSVKGVNLSAGTHTLRVSFETGDVNFNYLDVAPGRVALPARIEAERYQRAFETTPNVNSGNACDRGDGVDAETTTDTAGGGCNVGWTAAGEWLEYDLSVAQAGAFDFTARLASAATGKTLRMSVDGADIGTLSAPGSGAQAFQDRTVLRVNLVAGSHTLRVLFPEGDVGLNFINVVAGPARSVVPYRIKATDFSAFQESDALHEGNCGSGSVDAETTTDPSGGCNIGWTKAGEWLEYALQVPASGKYHLSARVASALTGKTFRFLVDSTATGAAMAAPSDGWQAFADRGVKDVQLAAGPHTLRVAFDSGDVNFAYVDVSPGTVDLPARLEAENYNRASETTPTVNSGAGCDRGDGVDKENTTDTGGGCTVGWTAGSEWLEYDVKVAQAGAFDVVARVASAVANRTLTVTLDGTLVGTLTLPSSGWAAFQDRTLSKINLTAGQHVFRVVFPQGDANFNYLNVTKSGTPGCTSDAQCADANACNGTETCNASGQCVAGQAPNLDDGNPCTTDACVAATGPSHVAVANGTACNDGNACTLTDTCQAGTCQGGAAVACSAQDACHTVGTCNAATGVCSNPLRPVGAACADGNACNGAETCTAQGACAAGTPPLVDDGNPCTADSCNPTNGVLHVAVATGTSCADANACNGAEACDGAGTCRAGTAPTVDDGNPCTVDSCDASQGVKHVAAAAGTSCADANACNGAEACDGAGTCRTGTAPTVDDGNPCTVDSCSASQGVQHVAAASGTACDDATVCNGRETCNGQATCVAGVAPVVDDDNPCTADACDAAGGVTHVALSAGSACSNDDACDGLETCNGSGTCVASSPPQVDDQNPCTTDSCDPSTGVRHLLLAVGSACSTGDCRIEGKCDAQGACVGGPPRDLEDGNPCTVDSCDAAGGVAHQPLPVGTACSDGNVCNGAETCTAQAACVAGAPPTLDDGNPCTIDSCDATFGVAHVPAPAGHACDDATLCNGHETCDGFGLCVPGSAPSVDDGNKCTEDQCDATLGVSHVASASGFPCADANICNGDEVCNGAGQCLSGTPPVLDDTNPCTADSCDASTGVHHAAVANGTACSAADACHAAGVCSAGVCSAGATVAIDDGNPCTADACTAQGGVVHTPLPAGSACPNGNACDGAEVCNGAGACTAGTAPVTDDGNPCTTDSCDTSTGVRHLPVAVGSACADGNACNGAETCNASGVCQAGAPPSVNDDNPCTTDACDPLQGVTHSAKAAGTDCSDGNVCNGLEACSSNGQCQAGTPPQVADTNPCTDDTCDPATGIQHASRPAGTSCSDSNPCNGSETCSAQAVCTAGVPLDPNDGDPCTVDSCQASGVVHSPAPNGTSCSDGNACNGAEQCQAGSCRAGASVSTDDANPCTVDECNPTSGAITHSPVAVGTACDNATVCDGRETCNAQGACSAGAAPLVDDGNPCTVDVCDAPTGVSHAPVTTGTACDDATLCNGREVCNGAGVCTAGTAPVVDDGNACTASGALDDTWTLNAVSGVWQRLTPTQKPPARAGAALAFDPVASRFVLVGGTGTPSVRFDDTWELNAASGAWQQLQLDRTPSAETGGVLGFDAQTNRLTFASGLSYSASGVFTPQSNAVWQLDRQAARWTDRASRQAPTELRLGAAFDSRSQTIVALGPVPPPERPLMWSFDPRASQWTAQDITDVDHPYSDGDFELPQPGATNLFYSAPLSRLISVSNDTLLEFDGKAWSRRCTFADVAQGPPRLAHASIAYDAATQRIYESGGVNVGVLGQPRNNQTYRIDLTTCTAELAPTGFPTPKSLEDSVAVWDSNRGRLIQFGGAEYVSNWVYSAETWEYDPSASAWTQFAGTAPAGRNLAAAVYDPIRRRVILHGGTNASGRLFDTWELDPETRVWTQLQTTGPALGEQATLVFDGVRQTPALVSTRGAVWHLLAGVWNADLNPIAPSARSGMSGGWSPISGLGMFFGGTSGDGQRDFLGDLWLWRDGWRGVYPGADGSSLIASGQITDGELNNVPASRTGHVFATGLVRFGTTHTALLFGGEGGSDQFYGLFGDTWTFDESTMLWHAAPKTLATPPRGRTGHAISVVPTRGYLMFGGLIRDKVQISGGVYEQRNIYLNETTLWQPNSWTSLSSSNPPSPRYGHAMVTDESTNEIILFGGRTETGLSGETWALSLNGLGSTANWRKLAPPTSPLPRFGHSMAYDPVRKKVVLTGGEGASAGQSFGDTWEWDSATQRWTARNIQPLEGRAGHLTFFDRTRAQLIAFGGFAHRDNGKFALTYGDTLAFVRPTETDASNGLPNGSRCAAAAECGSGNCVDGFCCNASCAGQCGACDVSGSEGTCTAVQGTPHGARPSCGGTGGECATQCNGVDMTQCNAPPVGTLCGPAAPACVGDNTLITDRGSCDASGACVIPQVSCGAYICCDGVRCVGLPKQCVTNCQGADSLCAIGYKCNGSGPPPRGQCYKPAQITSFSSNPASAKVGVPMTFTVAATGSDTSYQWQYKYQSANTVFLACSGTTCNWTPVAADAGKTITWTINVVAPGASTTSDDTRSLVFTVQP